MYKVFIQRINLSLLVQILFLYMIQDIETAINNVNLNNNTGIRGNNNNVELVVTQPNTHISICISLSSMIFFLSSIVFTLIFIAFIVFIFIDNEVIKKDILVSLLNSSMLILASFIVTLLIALIYMTISYFIS